MFASALTPSRGRFEQLVESTLSLFETSSNPDEVEVLVKLDWDDENSITRLDELSDISNNIKVLISPRQQGYLNLHTFYNQLCSLSTGRWCLLWNDDVFMKTQNWDAKLREINDKYKIVVTHDTRNDGKYPSFPIFTRSIYEKLGYISTHCCCDSFIEEAFIKEMKFGVYRRDIVVDHRLDREDATHAEGQAQSQTIKQTWKVDREAIRKLFE